MISWNFSCSKPVWTEFYIRFCFRPTQKISRHGFCDTFVIFQVLTSLNERKGWFATKLSDDTAVLDFFHEFDSGKIYSRPSPAENQAGNGFFPENKK